MTGVGLGGRASGRAGLGLVLVLAAACGETVAVRPPPTVLEIEPPPHFPPLAIPADNPLTREKAELGRHLFYDVRLSGNETQSCATCHEQARAFSDGRAQALGSTGELHRRSAMAIVNPGYLAALTWANSLMSSLEKQALVPMFGENPVELGLAGMEDELLDRLRAEPIYGELFRAAYPEDPDPISLAHVTRALASFERVLFSGDAPYDRFVQGDEGALSDSARRGMDLFFGERLECYHCHGGLFFADALLTADTPFPEAPYHNTGLYNVDGQGAYPIRDQGLKEISERDRDMGRFRAPTLRNIELTAPYMHDGSIETLDLVLDHYAAGGRTISAGPDAGIGKDSPLKDGLVPGFELTPGEREDVIEFLKSLTDRRFVENPTLSNPFVP